MGSDGLESVIFKTCAEELSYPLYLIFCKSLDTGVVPDLWRKSEICPIHKKGPSNLVENFRPVNLTQIPSKGFESLLKKALTSHLDAQNLFSVEQHGFLKGRSCQSNILECKEEWTRILDEGDWVDVVYFDYKMAFDSVNHHLLIEKLKWYGISGKIIKWMEAFLSNRFQRVKIGNAKSSWRRVLSGTTQGSVIGVILFILYINDLPHKGLNGPTPRSQKETKIKLLADDTKAFRRISKSQPSADADELQKAIDDICEWSEIWQMKIHPDKTKVLHLGNENPKREYGINGKKIAKTDLEKDIGFLMNETLTSSNHVSKNRSRALGEIATIRRSFDYLDENTFKLLYNQKIRPHLEWGSIATPPDSRAEATTLERVQSKATHLLKNLGHLSAEERRKRLNLFALDHRRVRGDLLEVYKITKGLTRINHNQFWEITASRNGPILKKEQVGPNRHGRGLKQRTAFFSYRVIKPWNWLPKELKESGSLDIFKRGLDALMKTTNWSDFVQQL